MNPDDLDGRLAAMSEPLSPAADAEARRMARATMPARLRRGRAPRARWVLPVLVAGAAALTGGAGTAALTMSHWAGVSMPPGNVRNADPIPVAWTTPSGHHEACRVWIELRHPHPGDQRTLDDAITHHDWAGLGQKLYDDGTPTRDDDGGESRVSDGLTPVVRAFADQTFPGIDWFNDGAGTDQRAVDAWGMTCAPAAAAAK